MANLIQVYRLAVEYPEGSQEPGWQPPGYEPDTWETADGYEVREFRWPDERLFLSRSGANRRAGLLRGWGASVAVLPSLPIEWPADADVTT